MNANTPDPAVPVPSQADFDQPFDSMAKKKREFETIELPREVVEEAITDLLDRLSMETPMHLRACSTEGCVEPTVAVIERRELDVPLIRLCALHYAAVKLALAFERLQSGLWHCSVCDADFRDDRAAHERFHAMSAVEQYQQEGR